MRRRRLLRAAAVTTAGSTAGCLRGENGAGIFDDDSGTDDVVADSETPADSDAPADWPSGSYVDYDTTQVTVEAADGDLLGTVTAAIAETREQRYLGLSDAESLPEDGGMLFVYDTPRESLTYVMRRMDFGIDIVYADAEGTITRIHNAPAPEPDEDGNQQRYPGSGQYVLEVPYEWTDRHEVAVGDVLVFEAGAGT